VITIHLVRHAQASFGAADYDQLSELGREQARVLGAALRARLPAVDAVVTGSMVRHRQTAQAFLAAREGAPAPRTLPGLDEVDHQELLVRLDPRYADPAALTADVLTRGGEPRRAFQAIFAEAFERWTGGRHDAEYAVSWPGFRRRCEDALEDALRGVPPSGTVLAFTSAGPIAALCVGLLGLPDAAAPRLTFTLVNAGITKLLRGGGRTRLSTLNEHAHLERERRLITYR